VLVSHGFRLQQLRSRSPRAPGRPLKEQLADTIAQHEQIAEEIERATEVRPNKEPAEDETGVV
jgi:hypothetical protein